MLFTSIFKAFFGIYMMKFFKNRPAGEIINPPILNDGLVPKVASNWSTTNDCFGAIAAINPTFSIARLVPTAVPQEN
jgi:hypothetical protein